jgi:hypothetical protein
MNKESLVKEQVNYQAVGEQISHELAAKMIKDHQDKNTVEGSFSFIIGKDIMEKGFSQPGCVGIRIYDAINEAGNKTLVCVGIDSNGKNIIEYTTVNEFGKIAVTEGMVWDKAMPPPPPPTGHPSGWLD